MFAGTGSNVHAMACSQCVCLQLSASQHVHFDTEWGQAPDDSMKRTGMRQYCQMRHARSEGFLTDAQSLRRRQDQW